MANTDFYESTAANELATAYQSQEQKDKQDLDLLLIFVLLFSANAI